MLARLLLVGTCCLALFGCPPSTDLGRSCTMKARLSDGGGSRPILESEIKEGANKDFLSFGTTDCEDFVCVRDSDFGKGDGGPNSPAEGYCSTVCSPSSSSCAPENPDDNNHAKTKLSCRALLLDSATLAAICADPDGGLERCKKYFGGVTTPYFCVRGGSGPDGGI